MKERRVVHNLTRRCSPFLSLARGLIPRLARSREIDPNSFILTLGALWPTQLRRITGGFPHGGRIETFAPAGYKTFASSLSETFE